MMLADVARVVALGASNLTRGCQTVVAGARTAWGRNIEVFAAFGHGRSYGVRSRIHVRVLPSILECGLWRELDERPKVPTRALVTDVGNDILYGYSPEQTLAWAIEAIQRLRHLTPDIVVLGLPLDSVRRLSTPRFLLYRSILVPACRLSLAQVTERAEQVHAGLAEFSFAQDLTFLSPDAAWYGFDPIHIRYPCWRRAWLQILGLEPNILEGESDWAEAVRLYAMAPERRWLLGIEQFTPQTGATLSRGGRVLLY